MASQPGANVYTTWAEQILASSVRNNKFHMHDQRNEIPVNELKDFLSKILIEANTNIMHSRFKAAITQLYHNFAKKHNHHYNNDDLNYAKQCWIHFPVEMWFIIFKASHKIQSIVELTSYVRKLTLKERLNLIFTIYNLIPNQLKQEDDVPQIHDSTGRAQSNESFGFIIKVFEHTKISIKKRKIKHKGFKLCIVKWANDRKVNSTNEPLRSNGLIKCKTSIWSLNRDLSKNTIMKANLIIECLIFLCELARGFDDLPIISYNRISIDKIPIYKRSNGPLFRVRLTIVQYEKWNLNFCFADLNLTFLISMKKASLKQIGNMSELNNLKWLEEYKQCFHVKQNYMHDEVHPLLSCVYLFKDINFSHIYKSYALDNSNIILPHRPQFPLISSIINISKCCLSRRNVNTLDIKDIPSIGSSEQQMNITNIYSDILYTIDLLFEQSQSNIQFPANTILPSINTILEWTLVLVLSTVYDSTLLYNVIIRLTLFGMELTPLNNLDGVLPNFTCDYLKFGFDPAELDICHLDTQLLLIHKLTSKSHKLSNLEYILTDINKLVGNNINPAAIGAKMKCLEKIMKFILCNLKMGYQVYLSDYEYIKQLIDCEINYGNLVSVDLLVTLSLAEMINTRYYSSLNYVKLALWRNELDTNCWRIIFTLKRINKQQNHHHLVRICNEGIRKRVFKGNRIKFHSGQRVRAIYALRYTTNIDLTQLPVESLSIVLMKTFKLAIHLEGKLLDCDWWFPWEMHIAKSIKAQNAVHNIQYDVLINGKISNLTNKYKNSKRSNDKILEILLQNLFKNDISGINDTLWVLSDIEFPLCKNEKVYELFIVLWALCHAGYAMAVIDLIGLNTKGDPHSSYLALYAQLCLTKNVYESKLFGRVRNVRKKYLSFHKLTRLEARLHLAAGEFIKAKRLFFRAKKGYFMGAKSGKCDEKLLSTLVDNICFSHSITSTDILCENYCRKRLKYQALYL
ncbi:hypothetical protein BmR1_04g06800 [Babesia microti strain RI]|uniref:Uncharacterized protein n=1 Tax=Babesia microti (strain RI) TaxID=1133968 RepID=I7ISD3_BABMR|nr:hypothetical protein BmR1_04g06800 [Babesia microti strain RI]CCF75556.1 hypothetical protein BmR1_04g06800 [Babesia microti strain RI]|eukprot:XP_012649964.1 hypothetical protein BmR1_04g06800 [Babesia microti strain RI]